MEKQYQYIDLLIEKIEAILTENATLQQELRYANSIIALKDQALQQLFVDAENISSDSTFQEIMEISKISTANLSRIETSISNILIEFKLNNDINRLQAQKRSLEIEVQRLRSEVDKMKFQKSKKPFLGSKKL